MRKAVLLLSFWCVQAQSVHNERELELLVILLRSHYVRMTCAQLAQGMPDLKGNNHEQFTAAIALHRTSHDMLGACA